MRDQMKSLAIAEARNALQSATYGIRNRAWWQERLNSLLSNRRI